VDTAGNPRYRMPEATKRAIQAARNIIQSVGEMIDQSEVFAGLKAQRFAQWLSTERNECVRMMERAIMLLRERTGAGTHALHMTQSESVDFLRRHPRLIDCVKHLFEQNQDRVISNLKLSPGQCSAMLYLMGCSNSDGDVYRAAGPRSEKTLNWDLWDKACQFWLLIGEGRAKAKAVRMALGSVVKEEDGLGGPDRLAIIAKAWKSFAAGEPITAEALRLTYHTDDDSARRLGECPTVRGIDLGEPADQTSHDDEDDYPSPE
jgi:hypothetical protein